MPILTIIVALPPDDIRQRIEALAKVFRQRYGDPCWSSLPTHITIIPPFRYELGQRVLTAIHNQVFPTGSLPVTCQGYDAFDSGRLCTIFAACASPELEAARSRLILTLPHEVRKHLALEATFHLTIARRVAHISLDGAMAMLKEHDDLYDCSFTIDRFYVYQQLTPRDRWHPFSPKS